MEMHQVRYFLAIYEEGNFTRAAKSCGVKQPSLTRAIQRLESEFGGPLFIRTKKGTTLSHLGRLVRTHFLQSRTVLLVPRRPPKPNSDLAGCPSIMSLLGVAADIG
jgi:LysR family hydrogen peroxide-inducible transcriptional activator